MDLGEGGGEDILFSLQKCEKSVSGSGGEGSPLFASLCPGDSQSVTAEDDGVANISISAASGFIGSLSSWTLVIRKNGVVVFSTSTSASFSIDLRQGDIVTFSYESGGESVEFLKVEVGFTFNRTTSVVSGEKCVAVWSVDTLCDPSRIGPVNFEGVICRESIVVTPEVPTGIYDQWALSLFDSCRMVYVTDSGEECDEEEGCASVSPPPEPQAPSYFYPCSCCSPC